MDGLSNYDELTDSISLVPLFKNPYNSVRDYAYSELYGPGRTCENLDYGSLDYGDAIIGKKYKLVSRLEYGEDGSEIELPQEFYDLEEDPFEMNDLLKGGEGALDYEMYHNLINLRYQRYVLKN